jgi:hypothetical protein
VRHLPRSIALGAALLLTAGLIPPLPAREAEPPDADLALVPADAAGVVVVRIADLWNSEGAAGFRKMARDNPKFVRVLDELQKQTGLSGPDVERLIVILPEPGGPGGEFIVISTVKPYDRAKVLAAIVPDPQEKKAGGKAYYVSGKREREGVYPVSPRTFIVSPHAADLEKYLERPAEKKAMGPLSDALARAREKHAIVIGLNGPRLARELKKNLPQAAMPLLPLFEAASATLSIDAGKDELRIDGRLTFATEDAAKESEKAALAARDLLRKQLAQGIEDLGKAKPEKVEQAVIDLFLRFLKDLDAALQTAKPERRGPALHGHLLVKTPEPASILLLAYVVPRLSFPPEPPKPPEKEKPLDQRR